MYSTRLRPWDSLKALWIILVLAALAFGVIAVSYPDSVQAAGQLLPIQVTCLALAA